MDNTKRNFAKCGGFIVKIYNGQGQQIINPSHIIKFMECRNNILHLTFAPFEGHFAQIEDLIHNGEHAHYNSNTKFSIELIAMDECGNGTSSITYNWVTLQNVIYPCFDVDKKDEMIQYEIEFHYSSKKVVDIKCEKKDGD